MDQPKLKAFLPFLYLVWSDDLLTQQEFEILDGFIRSQDWLSAAEKAQLRAKVSVTAPPSRAEINGWAAEIRHVLDQQSGRVSLAALPALLSANDPDVAAAGTAFLQLEQALGLPGTELLDNLKSKGRSEDTGHTGSPGFDVSTMTRLLDGGQAGVIRLVKDVITRPGFAYGDSTGISTYRERVYDWCRMLAAEGLGSMAYPETYGGGGDMAAYFAVMETLSYHDLSLVIKFGVQFGLWGMSVYSLGTEKHHRQYLADIGSLRLPGCFAMTETGHGSNVKGLETTATYHHADQRFTIHTPHAGAQKEYIGNAAQHGRMATVFAKLIIDGDDYGVNAFIVPLRDGQGNTLPGITIGDCGRKMGLNGVDNGTIRFTNVHIPKENMLDRFARVNENGAFESEIPSDNRRFFTMLGTLVGGRVGIPRSALSAAKSGLAIAIKYSDRRRQFGPDGGSEVPVLNYPMHQRRLMIPLAKTYALHFSLQYLTRRYLAKSEPEAQEIEALAAGLKAYTTWATRDSLQECREACGGKGYLWENRIAALKDDTEIYTTFEGDNTVLMLLVAKSRLAAFRKLYGRMDAKGIISYVYEQARTAILEKNPVITRNTDPAHLLDGAFHLQAFQYREHTMLAAAARRLKKLMDSGMDAYDAFNAVQHQLLEVARAYLDRVVLEEFLQATGTADDQGVRTVLERLRQLFALSLLEQHKGWYLEDGYMEPVKTKAVRRMVDRLCQDLRPDAVALTDAFGIPAACLAAPIAAGPAEA